MAHILVDAVVCWKFTSRRISTVPNFKGVSLGPKLVWEIILFSGHRRTPVNIQYRGKSAPTPGRAEITSRGELTSMHSILAFCMFT